MSIRLLYFCSDYIVGLTQALTEQIEYLSKEDDIELFCISSEKEQEKGLHERLKKTNVNVIILKDLDVHSNFKQLAESIGNVITDKKITHVNVHNNWQLGLLGYLKLNPKFKHKFKLIYTIHGYRHNHPGKAVLAVAMIGGALCLLADRVISMSDYVSRKFWFLSHKIDRVFYIMNKPEYFKDENIIDISSLSMVFPAQFRTGKRQDMLILALDEYIKKTGDLTAVLHLPGDGPLLNEMKKLTAELGLENNVKFYGKISLSKVLELYEHSNIALCSSNVETYGRCIAEPFMLGRCLITQRTGVAGDIIKDGINGFIFKTQDDLTKILIGLHNRPERVREVAMQAFKDRTILFPENVMKSYLVSLSKA